VVLLVIISPVSAHHCGETGCYTRGGDAGTRARFTRGPDLDACAYRVGEGRGSYSVRIPLAFADLLSKVYNTPGSKSRSRFRNA
jgi:hypothetical protein